MQFGDLLSELRENILRDNAVLASGPNDQLWTDTTLVRYIGEAQNRWAKRTLCIRDNSTPSITQVTLATGVASYDLDPTVLAVISATYGTNTYDMTRVGRALLATINIPDPAWFDPTNLTSWTPGPPIAFDTDETISVDTAGAVNLKVYPTPSANENGTTVYLRVARLPQVAPTTSNLSTNCELPADHQLDMLEWAAFLALRTSDIDGHSDRAAEHEKRFTEAVAEQMKDVRRKMMAPTRWGFGANGFTWDNFSDYGY